MNDFHTQLYRKLCTVPYRIAYDVARTSKIIFNSKASLRPALRHAHRNKNKVGNYYCLGAGNLIVIIDVVSVYVYAQLFFKSLPRCLGASRVSYTAHIKPNLNKLVCLETDIHITKMLLLH